MRRLIHAAIGRALALVALLLCPAVVVPLEAAKNYTAERFDSRIRVLPGGSLEVTETVAFRFESGTFDHVFREIPVRHTDGIEVVSGSMDGRAFPIGDGVNHLQVSGRSKVRVQWRFYPLADSTHVFVLTYVARGAVSRTGDADVVAWRALPSEHGYRIESSTVEFEFPAALASGASSVAAPKIDWQRTDGAVDTTLQRGAEDTAAAPAVARTTASRIRANGWLEARFDLPRGSVLTTAPAWQLAEQAERALAPRWAVAAVILSLAGLIVLFGLRQQYDPPRRDQPGSRTTHVAPDALSPGVVGTLLSNGHTTLEHAMATLLSLAERGIVSIEEQPRRLVGHSSFGIRAVPTKLRLAAHERALMSIALDETKIGQATSLSSARRRLMRRFRQFSAAMLEDLVAASLVDPDRKRVRDRYVRVSVAMVILSSIVAILAGVFLVSRYGPWPMLIPAALVVIGVAAMIFAAATTPLSNEGLRRAAAWRGFREYLKELTHDRQAPATGVQAMLPVAVATGLATGWARYLKRHPGSAPAWFRALSDTSRDRAFTVFVMSAAAHGSGGHAGGGAAGGGASGAG